MKDRVVIIGGGIAGMEAAKQLNSLGYEPIIIEYTNVLGGHVAKWHKLFPDMTPAKDFVNRLIKDIADVNVFYSTRINDVKYNKGEYEITLNNGIIIKTKVILIASGFKLYDATRKEEYGYGVYDKVITNADLESWFNGSVDKRISKDITSVGFVHCVGSRDVKAGNSQCSKVCCITALKQAIEIKEKYPNSEVYCFYMDLRLFGKKYEDFYTKAQLDYGIHFIRGRVSEVCETIDGKVQVKAEDTLSGKPLKKQLDLLVLMSGMVCNPKNHDLANNIGLNIDEDGFLKSINNVYDISISNKPGIFYAGACTGTKTVPETLAEARATVLNIHDYLTK